ncbi:MAG: YfiR family protein [Acidobacteria bacterium]|nr:YfiR family protein [Acidobacteriota bacterium]
MLAATDGASQVLMRAQAVDAANSRQVKAEFIVSFLSFVDWPATKTGAPQGQLLVAILGDPDFAELVRRAATHRPVAGRSVVVQEVPNPEGARDAHLAFIGSSEAKRLPAILRSLATQPVLTVGDTDGFAHEGVAINLYTFDKRIRIEVNTTAAERAGLRLSSNLLRLARIVQ